MVTDENAKLKSQEISWEFHMGSTVTFSERMNMVRNGFLKLIINGSNKGPMPASFANPGMPSKF